MDSLGIYAFRWYFIGTRASSMIHCVHPESIKANVLITKFAGEVISTDNTYVASGEVLVNVFLRVRFVNDYTFTF